MDVTAVMRLTGHMYIERCGGAENAIFTPRLIRSAQIRAHLPPLQAVNDLLRAPEYEGYVQLANRYGKQGAWLDIGCGSGGLLRHAHQHGYKPEGIEVADERQFISASVVPGAKIYHDHLEVLGLPDSTYEVVSLINVFSHLVSPARTFAEIRRVLVPNGILILRTGEIGHARIGSRYGLTRTLGDENQWLGDGTLNHYANSAGFAVLDTMSTPYLEWVLASNRLAMPSNSKRINFAKTFLRNLPGRRYLIDFLSPFFPMSSKLAVLRKY